MNYQKHLKGTAIAVMVLGFIHVCATPVVIGELHYLKHGDFITSVYMFVATGLAVILSGWVDWISIKNIYHSKAFFKILIANVSFLLLFGIGAAALMPSNPFAFICLLIALYQAFLLNRLYSKYETAT
jgi:hypothetical protein